jgi:glycosyltransferase involved in cell wall biosynthesis
MAKKNDTLLTVSGTIPADIQEQIQAGRRPTTDYIAMAEAFQADLIDFPLARSVSGWFGAILEKLLGKAVLLAWACFLLRNKYRLIFSDGEQVGIPLAFLLKFFCYTKRPSHFMIVHILSVRKKTWLLDLFGLHSHIDRFFVYATFQKDFIQHRWKLPEERVIFTPFMVDHHFFSADCARGGDPLQLQPGQTPVICSVGLEFRDYATLIEAVRGLDVKVIIAAGSPWSKRKDTTAQQEIPSNVIVKRFSQFDLRDVYAASRFLVMPLYPVQFQAGVTAILEAMAMGKAVICTRTPGQTDVIVEGKNGRYVAAQDAAALRKAIVDLLDNPAETEAMGRAGKQLVDEEMSLERYTERLKTYVQIAVKTS